MSMSILSNPLDEFLDVPTLTPDIPKVERPAGESNVCVQLATQGKAEYYLVSAFSALCAPNQSATHTQSIALLVLTPGRDIPLRIGYCSELIADSVVLRLCLNSGADCVVYRNYATESQRVLTESDLERRPFRF
jgi:hypothetical protein